MICKGGPRLNDRREQDTLAKRRAKLGSRETWFKRRRGGHSETIRKEQGWRWRDGTGDPARQRRVGQRGEPTPGHRTPKDDCSRKEERKEKETISTLLVPHTMGSALQKEMQRAEDQFTELTAGPRVRIVEKGGDVLSHLLGRNDPWGSARPCTDPGCPTCRSRSWLQEQKKLSRKTGVKLPDGLIQSSSNNCRREGATYSLQCLTCLDKGMSTLYHGESSRSTRQRHIEHEKDLEIGATTSPLVIHSIEEHGGERPQVLYVTRSIQPKALYRAVVESVMIAGQPAGPRNLNRCQEWGAPRVPILGVSGGGGLGNDNIPQAAQNPYPDWSMRQMEAIRTQGVKRVKLWDKAKDKSETGLDPGPDHDRVGQEDRMNNDDRDQQQLQVEPPDKKRRKQGTLDHESEKQKIKALPRSRKTQAVQKKKLAPDRRITLWFPAVDIRTKKDGPKDSGWINKTKETSHGPQGLPGMSTSTLAQPPSPQRSPRSVMTRCPRVDKDPSGAMSRAQMGAYFAGGGGGWLRSTMASNPWIKDNLKERLENRRS